MQRAISASLLHPTIALPLHPETWPSLKGLLSEMDGTPIPPPNPLPWEGTRQDETGSLAELLQAALPAQRHADLHVGLVCSM